MLLGLSACDPAVSSISNLEDLVDKIEANHESYTQEDWENIVVYYSEIEQEIAKHEYTDEQLKEIGRLKGQYMGYLADHYFNNIGNQIKDLAKELEGGIEGFLEVLSDDNHK
jgi:hypothetical protein